MNIFNLENLRGGGGEEREWTEKVETLLI